MILALLLTIILAIILVITVTVISVGGAVGIILFSDVIVCIAILALIIRKIVKKKK